LTADAAPQDARIVVGDREDDDAFMAVQGPRVRGMANVLAKELGALQYLDDITAFGFAGLIEARNRYDADNPTPFDGYSYYRIRGAMIDGLEKIGGVSRWILAQVQRDHDAVCEEALTARDQRGPERTFDNATAKLDELLSSMTGVIAAGVLAEADQTPETKLLEALEHARLRRAFDRLSPRQQEVLRGKYWRDETIEHIAGELRTTDSTISRDHHLALAQLRAALG
jgi:RNA polymerase sigma factor for flagellar operon FliA